MKIDAPMIDVLNKYFYFCAKAYNYYGKFYTYS